MEPCLEKVGPTLLRQEGKFKARLGSLIVRSVCTHMTVTLRAKANCRRFRLSSTFHRPANMPCRRGCTAIFWAIVLVFSQESEDRMYIWYISYSYYTLIHVICDSNLPNCAVEIASMHLRCFLVPLPPTRRFEPTKFRLSLAFEEISRNFSASQGTICFLRVWSVARFSHRHHVLKTQKFQRKYVTFVDLPGLILAISVGILL